jgi:glycosyltransferase involved in cell wall biosynthesis
MRVGYWTTSCLQPEIEAVSKEVFQLASHFHGSFIFGVSPHYVFRASWKDRSIGFHYGFDPLLRLVIPVVERTCDINHVYGDPNPWTFYKSLRSRPLVLTVASGKGLPRADFIARCRKVLVQTNSYFQKLRALGVETDKLELLYPGVDLHKFHPGTRAASRHDNPKILFASAPRSEEEMRNRGVYLLLEAAKISQEAQYHLLYREWRGSYTSLAATRGWLELQRIKNVTLTNSVVKKMHRLYRDYDFTIIPYTTADGGKECPTSAVEGLACGLPVLISSFAPFAEFVDLHKCGVVFDPTPAGVVSAVETGVRQYRELSTNAVNVARRFFSSQRLLERMTQIYEGILSR